MVFAAGIASAQKAAPENVGFSTEPTTVSAAATSGDIITAQPAGTLIDPAYGSSAQTWMVSGGMLGTFKNSGYATKIVRTDNAIYVQNMITELGIPDYWVKGDIESDGTVVFRFPQHIYHRDATDTAIEIDYYIGQLTPTLEGSTVKLVAVEGQTDMRMKLEGDRLTQIIPEIAGDLGAYSGVVGACFADGSFRGFGEKGISYRLTSPMLSLPPASLQTKPYIFEYTDGSDDPQRRTVQIGVDGNDVWIQGVNQFISTSWIKGTLADGKVTFGSSYTGVYENFLTYVTGLSADTKALVSPFTLSVNGTGYTADQTLLVNIGDEFPDLNNNRIFKNAKFSLQEIEGDIIPSDPIIDDGEDGTEYDETEGILALCFMLDATDSEGNTLDSNKLYYNVLIDGKVYEFDGSLYGQTMTDVPYNYNCDFIYNLGGYILVFMLENPDTVGVRAVYKDGDYTSYSATASHNMKQGGVDAITADSPVVSSTLYTIDGRQVKSTDAGNIYIRLDRRADGTATAIKFVAK